ncbi:MAG: T9SS type A sorting domain-containing protein [Bacteroidales bacterium]|nr:T9SS type A sorting domain-containing protein [Bacteroidales bacterium]
MIAGLKVYDFGGTLGKCLVLNTISGFNEAITEITGYDMGITTSEYTGYHQLYWVYDPEKGCEEGEHFRVHIELNVFTNPVTTDNVWGAYTNNNCNSVEPADDNLTTNRDIAGVRFAKYWGEVEGTFAEEDMGEGNEYTNENYEYEWNPERFMVYEYDTNAHGSGLGENEDGTANVMGVLPLKIKMEIPAGSAIIFKAVDIYVVPDEDTISWKNPATEEYEDVTDLYYRRNLESKYYTIDPANVGIRNIVADNALNVNVNGRTLSTNVAARVYNTNGQLVRVLKAGQEATLAAGLYIVNAGANSQKVIVK